MKELDVFRYLKKYREDRTLYEHNLIDTDYNGYVIEVFSSAPASSSPAVQEQLQGRSPPWWRRSAAFRPSMYETNDEYNEYLGAQNIMMLSNVRVTERFPILIFAVLIMVIFGALGCAGAALFGRIEDFKETGPLMQQLETHDLTFAFGPFLLYLLLHWRQSPRPALWLAAVCFFFLVGLKRIAIPAVALGLLAAWLLELLPEKAARQAALSTAVGASPEAVTGENGILVEPGDIPGLAEGILRLSGDPELLGRMSKSSRERAERLFSLEKMHSRLAEHYRQVLGKEAEGWSR